MGILSDIGAFSNPYGTPSQGAWNLARGVYTNDRGSVIFFFEVPNGEDPAQRTAVDQITDSGGRRTVVYKYPYKDGQRVQDLGREGETYSFNIKFHGANYQLKFQEFLDVVYNSNSPGTIIHPVRSGSSGTGSIAVRPSTYEFIHRHDEWNSITIRAVFLEDQTNKLLKTNTLGFSVDSEMRNTLQNIITAQAQISQLISDVSALVLLPGAIKKAMTDRLASITSQANRLMGQLGSTFSTDRVFLAIAFQTATLTGGGVSTVNSGTAKTLGSNTSSELPPVYQVGFDPVTQAKLQADLTAFANANQITTQQAVFKANQSRQAISAAITEIDENFGNFGYDIVVTYRGMAVSIQQATEACIANQQRTVKTYVVLAPMSLRAVAYANGLTADDQNNLEALNPYLPSVNYLPAGTRVVVPA